MTLYELTHEGKALREAERLVSLDGRSFPTLVMRWESRLFDQTWQTTLVLDYAIALPPLVAGQARFNEVRIAAFVAGAPTKFFYFGTELGPSAPRIGPEMENVIGSASLYQEFRLDEQSCPVPYLKLIQTTPRIYGNGAQDYYSPAIKVERYDGVAGPEHLADFFPKVVADLDPIPGRILSDPSQGSWQGTRFVGPTAIAIKRQGKVVGLHQRVGRVEKEALPASVKVRDPALDVRKGWVAIDFGAASTVVGLRTERGSSELIRIGAGAPAARPRELETPSEVAFLRVAGTLKAWRERVVLPATRWEDARVGFAAREHRTSPGPDLAARAGSTLVRLPELRERIERKEPVRLRGLLDPETNEQLKRPVPPVIDEDGIGANDPFDPVELFAYHVGLTINQRARGLFLKYLVSLPAGLPAPRRQSLVMAFRRGLFRSLPAGLVPFEDTARFEVRDAGASLLPFVAHATRVFGLQPKGEPIPFFVIDAGASETSFVGGVYRDATANERADGLERVVEHLSPEVAPAFGAERLLHTLAAHVYAQNAEAMSAAAIPFELPHVGDPVAAPAVPEALLAPSPEGRANVTLLMDLLRPAFEGSVEVRLPGRVTLLDASGAAKELPVTVTSASVVEARERAFAAMTPILREALERAAAKVSRGADPYAGLHVFLAGRLAMNERLAKVIEATLPDGVKLHRFVEPGPENPSAPTVRTAVVLGALATQFDRVAIVARTDAREVFRFRVGRVRHGELAEILGPSAEYDVWRELGACTKPSVELLFLLATDDAEVAADDPRVKRAECPLGADAVGQRVYVRAVGPAAVEVTSGPPGGDPAPGAAVCRVALDTGATSRA